MKKVIYGVLAFAAFSLTSCGGTENTEATENKEEVKEEVVVAEYQLDTENSKLEWTGSWVGGENDGKSHNGVVHIAQGTIMQDGEDFKGNFVIDMSSIDVQDIDAESGKPKLEGHLSNEDFFNVSKHSKVDVKVMEVIEDQVKLMINVAGVQMERTVPMTVKTDDNKLTMKGEFAVDFTEADMPGMKVKEDKPEEGAVSTEIEFDLHVEMMKK
ncbi:YceI family protein [Brumimicrobium mesophilum]|uniref:YceI family protein n=1 Tax=Brumimicrobium mesophilum TaxID=392717 RepID=UPI000D1422DD|nr:YceI family protein [Brumimicrobium mesophilum]